MSIIPAHGATVELILDDKTIELNTQNLEEEVFKYSEPITFTVSYIDSIPPLIKLSHLYECSTGSNLPGSLKTKRLRKKRNKALMDWITKEVNQNG